jgi:hypothetical protein
MPVQFKRSHPALKHGGYSATAVLPGESAVEFEKLHERLIAEYAPNGAHEENIVATIARLIWRKHNQPTFRIAERARSRVRQLINEKVPQNVSLASALGLLDEVDPAARKEATRAAEEQARKEFGIAYELVEIGETATIEGLLKELDVEERLEKMIDKCLKRLFVVRGLKSITAATSSAPLKLPAPVLKPS